MCHEARRFLSVGLAIVLFFALTAALSADPAILRICKKSVTSADLIENPCVETTSPNGDLIQTLLVPNPQYDDSGLLLCNFMFWSFDGEYHDDQFIAEVPNGMTQQATAWYICGDPNAPGGTPSHTFISGIDMYLGEPLLSPVVESVSDRDELGDCGVVNPCLAGYPLHLVTAESQVDDLLFHRWHGFSPGDRSIEPDSSIEMVLYGKGKECPYVEEVGFEKRDCNPCLDYRRYELELIPYDDDVLTLKLDRICTQVWGLESCGCLKGGYCPLLWAEFDFALLDQVPEIRLYDARNGGLIATAIDHEGTIQTLRFRPSEGLLDYGVFTITFPDLVGDEARQGTLVTMAETLP